jgi:hypothetical protein
MVGLFYCSGWQRFCIEAVGWIRRFVKRMAVKAAKTLPVEDNIALHKKGWVIQRIGWGLMFAFLLAAVLGLFGEGPLSKRKVTIGHITVEYERFGRYEHGMIMRVESRHENINTIVITDDYLRVFRISNIVPRPQRQAGSGGDVEFYFEGPGNTEVTFYTEPVERRSVNAPVKVNNNSFSIKQTIYP